MVTATATAPRAVRAVVRDVLAGHPDSEDVMLVASELTVSAYRSATGLITVTHTGSDPVCVTVTDQGGTKPRQRRAETDTPDPLGSVRHAIGDCTTWAVLAPTSAPLRPARPHH